MSTTPKLDRQSLAEAPASYFRAVDAKDIDETLERFTADSTLTVQTDGVTFSGIEEIRRMFLDFFASRSSIFHEITNIVVDPDAKRVSTEQRAVLVEGEHSADMHNCNFFDINEEGKFSRVIIWMDGANPLQ